MEDRCVCCGEVVPEGRQICPICQGEYDERPAVSRKDKGMHICPDCATKEALDDARPLIGSGMTDSQWDEYKDQFIQKAHEARDKRQEGGWKEDGSQYRSG